MPINAKRLWFADAIRNERRETSHQLWKDEPTLAEAKDHRFKRMRFLRKHGKNNSAAITLVDHLDTCSKRHPCLSSACPQCGRLFQRAWVRASKPAIKSMRDDGDKLAAISLVIPQVKIPKGQLDTFDIVKFKRQLKSRLKAADITVAIGGVDFSFNEDRDGKYEPFWCPHAYVITSTSDRRRLLTALRGFKPTLEIPRPKRITKFRNNPRRRSYAMKMHFKRRITFDDFRVQENGKIRYFRNTSTDRLRADELFELLLLLDKIGFAARTIFMGIKPVTRGPWAYFRRITTSLRNGES